MEKRYLLGERAANWLRSNMGELAFDSTNSGETAAIDERRLPLPLTVKFSQQQNSGAGRWIVWVSPETLIIDGQPLDVTGSLTAATGDYALRSASLKDRWYQMTDFPITGDNSDLTATVWLNVAIVSGEPVATFDQQPSASTTCVLSERIAIVRYEAATTFRSVTQLASGVQRLTAHGCFALRAVTTASDVTTAYFANPYVRVGGKTYTANIASVTAPTNGIIAVRVPATGSTFSATLATYANDSALYNAEADLNFYTLPLYKFAKSAPVCDYRTTPLAAMGEFA